MISYRSFSVAIGFLLLVASVTPLVAQRRGPRGRIWTKAEVNQLIKNAEDRSDRFIKLFDRALDRTTIDGSRREDRLNERAKDLEKAMDKLRSEFDRKENYPETKPEMREVLRIASEINAVMLNRSLGAEVEEEWRLLRRELNVLASVYFLPGLRG
jgi:hypothetical protein